MKIKLLGYWWLMAGLVGSAAAQSGNLLTIKDIQENPIFTNADIRERDFRWSPDSKAVYYFIQDSAKEWLLMRYRVDTLKIDTVLHARQCIYRSNNTEIRLQLRGYQFFPDGKRILLSGGEDYFYFDLITREVVQITNDGTEKTDVMIAPNSKYLAYRRANNLWVTSIEKKKSTQLTNDGTEFVINGAPDWVYAEEFDLKAGYVWSPDSKWIAFLQLDETNVSRVPIMQYNGAAYPQLEWQFYPKAGEKIPEAHLFAVNVETGARIQFNHLQRWNEYIVRFDWLPDTSLIAIQTLNRLQNYKCLLYGNPHTGECRKILEEKDAYWLNLTDVYAFLPNRQFIMASERSGYQHLYLYDFEGNLLKQLTSGEWMVTDLDGVDFPNKKIYFTANKLNLLRRNPFCCNWETGEIVPLDTSRGVHRLTMSPDCQYYLDNYASTDQPTRTVIKKNSGKSVAALISRKNFKPENLKLGSTRYYEIPARDGTLLQAALTVPYNFDPNKKYPVLVYVYGGPHVQVVMDNFKGGWTQLLTQQGYLVFSLDNRGSYGRGRQWERQVYLQLGKYELQDQLEGVKFLKNLPFVDPNRIGIWGASYGGYMVLMALTKAPEVFKIGIALAPVTHWKFYDALYTERYMNLPKDHGAEYFDSSPLNFVANLKAKLLLTHGLADDNVHFQNSAEFVNELIKHGKQFQLMTYPNRGHGVYDPEGREHWYQLMLDFIKANL